MKPIHTIHTNNQAEPVGSTGSSGSSDARDRFSFVNPLERVHVRTAPGYWSWFVGLVKAIAVRLRASIKTLGFPLLVAVVLLGAASTASAGVIIQRPTMLGLNNGLVGCWNFDGSYTKVPDCSGNGNTGTLLNSPRRVSGRVGQALRFRTSNDYVQTTATLNGLTAFTVSLWTRPDSLGNNGTLWSNDGSAGGCQGEGLYFNTATDLRFKAAGVDNTVSVPNITGEWVHVLATYDDTNKRVYFDGLLVYDVAGGAAADGDVGIQIGRYNSCTSDDYYGIIDDVRVYNRAVSANEIARLYRIGLGSTANRTSTSSDTGLVGHWTFDGPDISGTRAKDRSGNNNHGTLTGGPVQKIGRIGQALSFDGNDGRVDIDPAFSFSGLTAFTVSMWAYPRNPDQYDTLWSNDDSGAGCGNGSGGEGVYWDTPTAMRFRLAGFGNELDNVPPIKDKWVHIVSVFSPAVRQVYFDQQLVYDQVGGGTTNGTVGFQIGGYNDCISSPNENFDGLIDDVRIYNRALSASEIRNVYQETQSKFNATNTDALTSGLLGYWTLDGPDISGTRAKDRSGNENHGTSTGGPVPKAGKIGQAFSFDGVDDVVDIGDFAGKDNAPALTIAFWGKRRVVGAPVTVGRRGGTSTDINIYPDGNVYCNIINVTGGAYFANNNTEWNHYVMTFDGTQTGDDDRLKCYLNSVSQSLTFQGAIPATTGNTGAFKIGKDDQNPNFSDGLIDEVRIYNRTLSASEVNKLYQMGR